MSAGEQHETGARNRLLRALPERERTRLMQGMDLVRFSPREVLFPSTTMLSYVYFPESAVVTLRWGPDDGAGIAVATVGYEGMVGLQAFLRASAPLGAAVTQVPGTAFRLSRDSITRLDHYPTFDRHLRAYAQVRLAELIMNIGCPRFHTPRQRLARYLLTLADRAGVAGFRVTQGELSELLGISRQTVNQGAGRLQRDGVIDYRRGQLTIRDRPALERVACTCYSALRQQFDYQLPGGAAG